jgi:hypothetical protein
LISQRDTLAGYRDDGVFGFDELLKIQNYNGQDIMKIKYVIITVILACILFGCTVTPLEVTLPERIQSVYIPMCKNTSYQSGIEELATNAVIEAFVADGRINVVEEKYADAMLEIVITKYISAPSVSDGEDFPVQRTATVLADVTLWEPNETEPTIELKQVTASSFHIVDPEIENLYRGDPYDALMANLGQTVLNNIMYGVLEQDRYLNETYVPIREFEDDDDIRRLN